MLWKIIEPITGAIKFTAELIVKSPSLIWVTLFFSFIFLPFLFFIFDLMIVILWFALFAMCLAMILSKPFRTILGVGIPILSLYVVYQIMEKGLVIPGVSEVTIDYFGTVITGNNLVYALCATALWAVPLASLSKKPLYPLTAFALFWIGFVCIFYFAPLLEKEISVGLFQRNSPTDLLGWFGLLLLAVSGFVIGIIVPISLIIDGFKE